MKNSISHDQEKHEAEKRWLGDGQSRTPIWLDCDVGHDDAFAILLASQCPAVELLGVSTIYGNASLKNTTYNARAILKAVNREDIPVYPGSGKPFCRAPASAPDIHGESGLDGTTYLPQPTVPAKSDVAIMAIYQALIKQPPKTAWIAAVGALTNMALLFATFPDLAEHVAGLCIMGGAVGGGFTNAPMGKIEGEGERIGNWSRWAGQSPAMNGVWLTLSTNIGSRVQHLYRPRKRAGHLLQPDPRREDHDRTLGSDPSNDCHTQGHRESFAWLRQANNV